MDELWKTHAMLLTPDIAIYTIDKSELPLHDDEFKLAFSNYNISKIKKVMQIEYGEDSNVINQYTQCKNHFQTNGITTREMYVFHGTPYYENIRKIIINGFKVGGQSPDVKIVHGAAHGSGVYTSTTPSTPESYSEDTHCLIVAKALCGNIGTGTSMGSPCDSIRPNTDWLVLKNGYQLLPVYVIYTGW